MRETVETTRRGLLGSIAFVAIACASQAPRNERSRELSPEETFRKEILERHLSQTLASGFGFEVRIPEKTKKGKITGIKSITKPDPLLDSEKGIPNEELSHGKTIDWDTEVILTPLRKTQEGTNSTAWIAAHVSANNPTPYQRWAVRYIKILDGEGKTLGFEHWKFNLVKAEQNKMYREEIAEIPS